MRSRKDDAAEDKHIIVMILFLFFFQESRPTETSGHMYGTHRRGTEKLSLSINNAFISLGK